MEVGHLPRVRLALLPSPLEELPRLSRALGGPRLLVKREDYTGLGLGGNKLRELEYILADALARGADMVVTTGGVQSNHARLTAAAARRLGLDAALLLTGATEGPPAHWQGNLLLDRILGAEIRFSPTRDLAEAEAQLQAFADELRRRGRRPYVVPVGGYCALGVMSYAVAMMEIVEQMNDRGARLDHIVLACGTGVTQAGLVLGKKLLGCRAQVHGYSVSRDRALLKGRMLAVLAEARKLLGVEVEVSEDDLDVDDTHIGEGYGVPTAQGLEAMELLARTEGLLLDPVYTGKAAGALIEAVRAGRFAAGETVLFLHTGGVPAAFAYEDWLGPGAGGLAGG